MKKPDEVLSRLDRLERLLRPKKPEAAPAPYREQPERPRPRQRVPVLVSKAPTPVDCGCPATGPHRSPGGYCSTHLTPVPARPGSLWRQSVDALMGRPTPR